MAHDPLKMSIEEARRETFAAWSRSYSPERNRAAVEAIRDSPIQTRIGHLAARLFFRGIYFPQLGTRAWLRLLFANRKPIIGLTLEGLGKWRRSRRMSRKEVQSLPGTIDA
jgi:hypothetical protein